MWCSHDDIVCAIPPIMTIGGCSFWSSLLLRVAGIIIHLLPSTNSTLVFATDDGHDDNAVDSGTTKTMKPTSIAMNIGSIAVVFHRLCRCGRHETVRFIFSAVLVSCIASSEHIQHHRSHESFWVRLMDCKVDSNIGYWARQPV